MEEDIFEESDDRPLVPEGDYILQCLRTKKVPFRYPALVDKVVLWFRIFEGPHADKVIPMYLRLKQEGHVARGSNYYFAWVIASRRIPERRRIKEMPPSVFEGKIFEGHITTVKQTRNGRVLDVPALDYSRVDAIYKLLIEPPRTEK